jgi:ABC-2 type transport system ATP-binding protein
LLAARGKAILYISHVLEVVEQVCNRVIVIAKGRVLADAPPADLTKLMHLQNLEKCLLNLSSSKIRVPSRTRWWR